MSEFFLLDYNRNTMPNTNGLTAGSATFGTGDPDSYLYVRRDARNGDSTIDGDLTVVGNLAVGGESTLPTIIGIDVSLNPIYIKNPKNLGINPITESAVIIEGGADRVDISNEAVALTLHKPISMNSVGGYEQIGALQFSGINSVGTTVRYGSVRGVCTNPTSGATKGRLEFNVIDNLTHSVRMEIDASANVIRTDGGARFSDRGYVIYAGAVIIEAAGAITKQSSATLVPESSFTIPVGLDGYYSFTAQISLSSVGTVADGDQMSIYLDVSGGSLSPIAGTVNILDMTENIANAFSQTPSGIIMQRLTAGQTIQLYHLEGGSFTFGSGSIQVAYTYLGDSLVVA